MVARTGLPGHPFRSEAYHRQVGDRRCDAPSVEDIDMGNGWTFADLSTDQVALVAETERSLGADVVMVFRSGASSWADIERIAQEGFAPDPLEPAQLERLQALERQLGAVAVAYRRHLD
jgi:hypothetical protein